MAAVAAAGRPDLIQRNTRLLALDVTMHNVQRVLRQLSPQNGAPGPRAGVPLSDAAPPGLQPQQAQQGAAVDEHY